MISQGQTEYPFLNLHLGEGQNTDFTDDSFDAIILFGVLTCIVDNKEQILLINEVKRLLRPGGILYINDFLINSDDRNISRYNLYKDKYQTYGVFESNDGVILRHHTPEWIKQLTSLLEQIVFETVTFPTMNGYKSNEFYFMGKNV